MKSKKFFKYIFKSLKKDFSRLIAIIIIVSLGVGFLIGLLSSTPTLYKSVDNSFRINNVFDINLKSTVGFSSSFAKDISDKIENIDEIAIREEIELEGEYQNASLFARIIYQPIKESKINKIELIEGNYPKQSNECVILNTNPTLKEIHIGDTLKFNINNLIEEFTVVGYVNDPYYIGKNDISSNVSAKHLQAIIYLDSFYNTLDYITDISISFSSLESLDSFSEEYENKVEEIKNNINETILENNLVKENFRQIIYENAIKKLVSNLENMGLSETEIENVLKMESTINQINQQVEEKLEWDYDEKLQQIYVLVREDNMDIYAFKINAEKVDLISMIFPVFFFLIATLVCLSSFSRIVSKDRLDIATLKSVGYSNRNIYFKYLFTGLITTSIGCILGTSIGLFVLPTILYNVYNTMYNLPQVSFAFQYQYIFPLSLSMVLLIELIIFATVNKYVKIKTAKLLVDNISKDGKKILLERVNFVWKHLKFKYKSMFRNIFMYKKNLLMMILGVGGCSALLLTAFGLNNSLGVLTDNQYKEIFKYNLIVETNLEEIEDLSGIKIVYYEDGLVNQNKTYKATLIGGNQDLSNYVNFKDASTGKILEFDDSSCFITKQLADKLHIKVGDNITYTINNNSFDMMVTDIVENYVNNYVYVGSSLIKDNASITLNAIMANKDFTGVDENKFIDTLNSDERVSKVVYTKVYYDTYNILVENLSSIIGIVILISGVLAIVVIYNIVDININERIKEIATLRVLGYQKIEVVMYIFREIFVMSIMGFIVGILFGLGLHRFIVEAISSPGLIFGIHISLLSYLFAFLLTVLFSLVVVIIFSPIILKINMAEALKSKE